LDIVDQETRRPGKTMDDLKHGRINPSTELTASAVGGAAAAAVVATGGAALPALAVGAAGYGTVMVIDQEIKKPGKTARDISRAANKTANDVGKVLGKIFR
jgi:hypothetical protein